MLDGNPRGDDKLVNQEPTEMPVEPIKVTASHFKQTRVEALLEPAKKEKETDKEKTEYTQK